MFDPRKTLKNLEVPFNGPSLGRNSRWKAAVRLRLRQFGKVFSSRLGSTLVRRIVLLNMAGLVALLLGFLWLNQTRLGVIDARVQSLTVQGEIIAAALAGTALVEGKSITIDPERLLELQAGETSPEDPLTALEFSLNPERIAPVIRRLVTPAGLRARVYDRDGSLLLDTRSFYGRGDIRRLDLPPQTHDATLFQRTWSVWKRQFGRTELTPLDDINAAKPGMEIQRSLTGESIPMVRVNASGETIVVYTLPIQRLRIIRGALQLSTEDGDIDEVIAKERLNILVLFLVVTAVMALVSLMLANTIAKPVERLAIAAERVKRSIKSRQSIPDFSNRSDEIGHLSVALGDMTDALYTRIAAIESFAADVAHELKNPLTSLRSAVETLPRVKTDDARTRLMAIIQHDVRRLDRLISDISDASRLDADLAKSDAEPVDMAALMQAVVALANDMRKKGEPALALTVSEIPGVTLALSSGKSPSAAFFVNGHDSRLAQVMNNLIDNAKSFSPPEGTIAVRLSRVGKEVVIEVEDGGPGIPEHARERIFERFYTDRPVEQGFGQNSGLGLSISRQIIEAHGGRITAANVVTQSDPTNIKGACFTVVLPAMNGKS